MKKIVLLSFLVAGMSAFAEMALVPINQIIEKGSAKSVLVARNAKLSDITRIAGYIAVTQKEENALVAPSYADGYFPKYDVIDGKNVLRFQLQARFESVSKTFGANLVFLEQDGDIYVYLYEFRYRDNAVGEINLLTGGSQFNSATNLNGYKPYLCGLKVWLAGRDRVADCEFWKSTGKTIWEGNDLSKLTDFESILSGNSRTHLTHLRGYNISDIDGIKNVSLQGYHTNGMTRAINVKLESSDGAIKATISEIRRNNTGSAFAVGGNSGNLSNVSTVIADSDNASGVGIRGVEALVDIRRPLAKYENWLQTSENRMVIWKNVKIEDILSIEGEMDGGWMQQAGKDRRPYHVKFEDGKFSLQYQAINDARLFCVKAVFVQNGENVEGYIEYARLVNFPAEGVGLGFDFDSGDPRIINQTIATGLTGGTWNGYGLKNVTAVRFPELGEDVFVWKGATEDGNLSNGNNWVGNKAPTAGAKLLFRDFSSGVRIVNDYPENTGFEGLYFAGRGSASVEFAGNALKVATIDNLSENAKVHISAPVICDANFEPWVGGGLSIDSLNVAGALAPRGKRTLGPLGTVRAGMLSGGNIHAWEGGVYGLGGAFVRRALNGAANASFDYLDTAGFTREVFEICGINTVANRLELPNGQIFAVKEGLTSVPDLGASGDDPHVNLAAGAQLHIRDYKNQYNRPVRFEGAGRVSFGAAGYAAGMTDVFDGVAFGTAGTDYTVAGAAKPGTDGKLRFAAKDPDGTMRAITFAPESGEAADLEVVGGILKAGTTALEGRKLSVSGGYYEPIGGTAEVPSIEFGENGGLAATEGNGVVLRAGSLSRNPKSYFFTGGSSISIPDDAIDLTGATIVFDAEFGTRTDVLKADSIAGRPLKVVSAITGKTIPFSIGEKDGLGVLTVVSSSTSLKIVIR